MPAILFGATRGAENTHLSFKMCFKMISMNKHARVWIIKHQEETFCPVHFGGSMSPKSIAVFISHYNLRGGMKEWLRGFQIWNDMMGRDWWCKSHMNLLPQAKVNSWESLQWWEYETLCHSARKLLLNPVLEGTRLSFCWVTDCNTGKCY